MTKALELIMIECENCKQSFFVENKTAENICSKCGTKNDNKGATI